MADRWDEEEDWGSLEVRRDLFYVVYVSFLCLIFLEW